MDIKCDTLTDDFALSWLNQRCLTEALGGGAVFPMRFLEKEKCTDKYLKPHHIVFSVTHTERQEKYIKSNMPSDVPYSLRTLMCFSWRINSLSSLCSVTINCPSLRHMASPVVSYYTGKHLNTMSDTSIIKPCQGLATLVLSLLCILFFFISDSKLDQG